MSARRPKPETRNRLASLLGGDEKVDALVDKYHNQLLQERTIKLANTAKIEGRADFFVLMSPGQGTATTVEALSFVNGDDKLKSLVPLLKTANFKQTLPDQTPVKIVRRGTLSCKFDIARSLSHSRRREVHRLITLRSKYRPSKLCHSDQREESAVNAGAPFLARSWRESGDLCCIRHNSYRVLICPYDDFTSPAND